MRKRFDLSNLCEDFMFFSRGSKRRGQATVEFMIMFGAALFFFVVFMSIVQMNVLDKNLEKQRIVLQNVAIDVRDEIGFASRSSDGYFREFYVSENILGVYYNITLAEDMVFVIMGNQTFAYDIPEGVIGNVQKGLNTIKKEGEDVIINA
ncbi:MAG: hypothetical protein HQ521_03500 [Bacteroidetes bacterium]|nr:hypothetical protein [Bacteroidota bacterium]